MSYPTLWKYEPLAPFQTVRTVSRWLDEHTQESALENNADVIAWVAEGNTIQEADGE
jgi:hypothetical protein